MIKILTALRRFRKRVLWIIGGPVIIRNPDRSVYTLRNVETLAKLIFISKWKHPNIFFAVHNRDDQSVLMKLSSVEVFCIPPCVDTELFRPMLKNDLFTIVANAAPANWIKGVDFLTKIILNIIHKVGSVRIIILTKGMGIKYFRNKLKCIEKKFPEKIKVIDKRISHREVASILGKSHLFIFPSRFEGFGIMVLEAQSCGLPVVAFNIAGAPREVILNGSTGIVVQPFDINEFAKQVVNYYKIYTINGESYKYIQLRCRERAMLYDCGVVSKLWIRHVEDIILG